MLIKDVTAAIDATGDVYRLLSVAEQVAIDHWWAQHFPFASWGRIQWSALPDHVCHTWTAKWDDLVDTFHTLCDTEELKDPNVVIIWSNALRPALICPLHVVRDHAAIIFEADFDTWLLCPSKAWCIEVYHEGEICFGQSSTKADTVHLQLRTDN
jgi:hypothetical protein